MSTNLTRIYKLLDVAQIKAHLFIYGDLSGACAACQKMDLTLDATFCPSCKAEFKYISFRNVKSHIPKIMKILETRPNLVLIDFEDYQRNLGTLKAREFLK